MQTSASDSTMGEGSTRCDGCKSCGAILELADCGHRFHARCIFSWPATHCEVCAAPVSIVRLFREYRGLVNSGARKGKWSVDEHNYANMMMKQFQVGALPLANGLHLRGFIANLLQCDPLRVTKKYAGHAIGKQNFSYQHQKNYCYNLHIKLQKRVSSLRNHYYWHIQHRCKSGHKMNIQELKAAEADYWSREFRTFAKKVGQQVEFTPEAAPIQTPVPTPSLGSSEASSRDSRPKGMTSPSSWWPSSSSVAASSAPSTPSGVQVKIELSGVSTTPTAMSNGKAYAVMDDTAPSMKESPNSTHYAASMERSLSPLSFDEWSDPSVIEMAFSSLSQNELPLAAAMETTLPALDNQGSKKKRGSLGDWIKDLDTQWGQNKGVPSWSFSLSDCA